MINSNLILGTAQFGLDYGVSNSLGKVEKKEIKNILDLAKDLGIKSIDTAISYGDAQKVLGEIGCKYFEIGTKIGSISMDIKDKKNWIKEQINSSLRLLKKDSLYSVLYHDEKMFQNLENEDLYEELLNYKKKGLIQKIGVSTYDLEMNEEQLNKIDVIQMLINLFNQKYDKVYLDRKIGQKPIEINYRSIFLQGLLLVDKNKIKSYFSKWDSHFEKYYDFLKKNELTKIEACLAITKKINRKSKIVVGVTSSHELAEIYSGLRKKIPSKVSVDHLSIDDENLTNPTYWIIK
jgi:hypothetical protein